MSQAQAWDEYWRGHDAVPVAASVKASTAYEKDWKLWAETVLEDCPEALVLDAACGSGVVGHTLSRQNRLQNAGVSIFSMDIAPSALAHVTENTLRVVGDAAHPPFKERSFDGIVSQFGLEYAGFAALSSVVRFLKPDGRIMLFVHVADGAIAQECAANDAVLSCVCAVELLDKAADCFESLVLGASNTNLYQVAFQGAVKACDEVLQLHQGAAADFASRLTHDCTRVIERHAAYAPEEIRAWFEGQRASIASYKQRMRSMLNAAIDEEATRTLLSDWRAMGLKDLLCTPMMLEMDVRPAAWRLVGRCGS